MEDKFFKFLGYYFLNDLYEKLYLLHLDYLNRDILVSFEKNGLNIKVLKKYDRVAAFMDKDYFYYIFSKDINFNASWNNFYDMLQKWVQLKEGE